MSEGVCKIFLKIDILFNDGKPDLETINKTKKYNRRCPLDNTGVNICKDNLAGIDALYSYLFNDLFQRPLDAQKRENNDNQYAEYVLIWLGSKLFRTESYNSSTLMDFYKKYLENTHRPYNYNYLIEKKKQLLDANLYYMSLFYQLFQEICYITLKYPKVNPNVTEIKNDSTRFYNKYARLYGDINECDSYLNLLNNLETLYENLKTSLIKNKRNRHLKGILSVNFKKLPPTKKANKKSTIGFDCPKCKKINSKAEETNPKPVLKVPKPVEPISPPEAPPLPQQVQSLPVPAPPEKPEPAKHKTPTSLPQADSKSPSSQQSDPKPQSESAPSSTPASTQLPLSPPAEQQPTASSQQVLSPEPPSPTHPPALTTTIQKESHDSQGLSNDPASQLSNQGNTPNSSDNGQHNTGNDIGKQGDGIGKQGADIVDKPEQSQDGQHQNSGSKQETSSGAPENGDNNLGSQGAEKGGSDTEPQNPTTQQNDQNITQGDSLNQQEDSGNMQLQNIFNIFKSTFEMYRSPFYNAYTEIGNRLYEKATSTLENVYDKSRKIASNTINYLNEHLNKALENDQPSKEKKPEPAPSLPDDKQPEPQNIPTPPQADQSHDNSQTPSPTQNMGSSNSKQVNPSDPLPEKQHQPSVDPSSKTPSLTIKTGNTGIIVKENTSQLVTIKDIYKGYNRPEIVITVILISIILLIVYKYLSYGWRKELKRKKNMKKVINSIGGKRPVQIIISSPSHKKQTQKSTNSVHRKKPPLLNIYKLMQADPIPFINLFFLLTFFVYKRKSDFLEL
ncbi:CIR protein PIR protein [Plasmodium vinckei]|uniref:CIR protein PIR protein n=1 Tax=Plasmodium vinckei TaxID=5860 RepID=A0A6V7SP38_PLAVN|nr:CIR protein PIR protein [Plasmodium vinckei]